MKGLLVLLVIVAVCVTTSVALQCYDCMSPKDTNCGDADSGIAKKDCDEPSSIEKLAGVMPVCMKMVFDVKGMKQVTRSCSRSGTKLNACIVVGEAPEHCSVCEKDLCNGSSPVGITNMWMTLIPAIMTVALIKFSY
ncbi:unnamed protein product [Diamesa serratosioi]